jgi:CrcB protein
MASIGWAAVGYAAAGGAAGTALRLLADWNVPEGQLVAALPRWCFRRTLKLRQLPTPTLCVNLLGAFVLGLLVRLQNEAAGRGHPWSPVIVALFNTGVLGGFTTFSTLCAATVRLWAARRRLSAAVFLTLSVVAGMVLAYMGWLLGGA